MTRVENREYASVYSSMFSMFYSVLQEHTWNPKLGGV